MKILHTADWHLGKKIEGKSMLANQIAALSDIERIAEGEKPDLVLICGDVFDTAVPPAEAERLFFDTCERLSSYGCPVVAIAGNHDDGNRLSAARSLAARHNIYLIGDTDNSFYDAFGAENGKGWIRIDTPSGKACIAALPYPLESFFTGLSESDPNGIQSDENAAPCDENDGTYAEKTNENGAVSVAPESEKADNKADSDGENSDGEKPSDEPFDEKYTDKIRALVRECEKGFLPGEVNIFAAHIFTMPGSEEKTLGGAKILPSDVLPDSADYAALGHVHKRLRISRAPETWYPGSLVPCSFAETGSRCVNIVEIEKTENGEKSVAVRSITLEDVKDLVKIRAKDYDEAYEKLSACDCYAEIEYDCPTPLTPAKMNALRALPAFVKFTPCFVSDESGSRSERKLMTDEQLFEAFFERKKGRKPDPDEQELFIKAVGKEDIL